MVFICKHLVFLKQQPLPGLGVLSPGDSGRYLGTSVVVMPGGGEEVPGVKGVGTWVLLNTLPATPHARQPSMTWSWG